MPLWNPTEPPAEYRAGRLVELIPWFLLRVEAHERAGLTRRCAVLATGSELGINPAVITRHTREVAG